LKEIRIIAYIFFTSVLFGTAFSSFASEQEIDGPIYRREISITAQYMLYQERFSELEKEAQEFRKNKTRLPDGTWMLQFFYEGLSVKDKTPEGWKHYFNIINKWLNQAPDSITARIAAAGAWIDYGATVRGKGYAESVSEEGWQILAESNEKALKLLETKPSDGMDDCPQRYSYLLNIARVQGWSRPQFEALFHEAVTFEPTYYSFYIRKAKYLLPRWYGEEGEWQQFAKDAIALTPASEGKSVYMRIVASLLMAPDISSLSDPRISWSLLKQGYMDVEKNFPGSRWNLNTFCKYACKAGDRETARELFNRIGEKPYLEAWGDKAEFEKWRKWSENGN
jgi:hypothetical protein